MADWRTDDRELFARILTAEAGNQGPKGMTAAGNVIMNRANTSGYGNGVRGVIMKPGQFSPMNSVTGYARGEQGQNIDAIRPKETAYTIVDSLLSGTAKDITGGATHFYNPDISNPSWAKGKEFTRIGDHVFGSADAGRGKRSPQAAVSTQGTAPMMQQEEETPRGLLGGLGIQKMQEGAPGETGQRFYERDSFKDTAAVLAQGFGRMGIMGMEEIADGIAKQRTEAKAKNKTVEYFRKAGRNDLADAVDSGSLGARDAAGILFSKPDKVTPASTIGKLQSDLSSGLITQEQYEVALANMAPKGMSLEISPDGTTRFVQGAGNAAKPLTEGQSKATGYFGKAQQAEDVLSALERQGTGLYDSLVKNIPIAGNYLISEEYQKYNQAKRNFINSILRQESGAAIGAGEFANAEQQYFPQPGEGAAVIAQKAANRRRAIEGLRVAAGEGANRIVSPESNSVIEYDATGKRIQN